VNIYNHILTHLVIINRSIKNSNENEDEGVTGLYSAGYDKFMI